MTKIKSLAAVNLVTPKAGAKHELFFNEPASVALGVTKFERINLEFGYSLFYYLTIN